MTAPDTAAAAAPKPSSSPAIITGSSLTLTIDLDNVALEAFIKQEVQAEIQRQVAAALAASVPLV